MFEDIVQLVSERRVSFPPFGTGASDAAIKKAEDMLRLPLPPSYKWRLANYGGGQIRGDVLYGVDENGLGIPDIVELAQMNERDGRDGLRNLTFSIENGEKFYFDTTAPAAEGIHRLLGGCCSGRAHALRKKFCRFP